MWGRKSSLMPGPLSWMQTSNGRDTRSFEPGTVSLTPGRNAVVMVISPTVPARDIDSAAFFARFRKT